MTFKKGFWNFLLKDNSPLKRSVYKKAVLRGKLTMLAIIVGVIYIVLDYSNNIYINLAYYVVLIIFSGITFVLNRNGKFSAANYVFLTFLNLLIYVFAANDTFRSGSYLYFIVTALTSITLCGYEQLRTGMFFCLLSLLLFILGYIYKIFPVMPQAVIPESYVTIIFIANFTVSLFTTSTLLYFLLGINNRTEEVLERNNELLTKTNKELDRFVYSASHDLRSPLSSMLGLVEIAKKSNSMEDIKNYLDMMAGRIKVQDSFIHDIIDYARNNRVSLSFEKIQMDVFVKDIINQFTYNEGAQEIDFHIQISEDDFISCDRIRLTSVLSNLISNAIKYHDTSKSTRFVRVSLVKSESNTEILVEDNGQGIHPNFQEKIFDMFFRASESSKGSGLGLFIVKETLEKMEGSISLRSDFGEGSCFSVILPNSLSLN